jgi:hypothetical protein
MLKQKKREKIVYSSNVPKITTTFLMPLSLSHPAHELIMKKCVPQLFLTLTAFLTQAGRKKKP